MPLVSMTGFGAASRPWVNPEGPSQVGVELRSVNSRFLELKIRQPFGPRVEAEIRRRLEAALGRGRVDVAVFVRRDAAEGEDDRLRRLGVDPARLIDTLQVLAQIEGVAGSTGFELGRSNSLEILKFLSSTSRPPNDPHQVPDVLFEALEEALEELLTFRQREGAALHEVLVTLATDLERHVAAIGDTLPGEQSRHEQRVRELLQGWREAVGGGAVDADRVAQEVAMLVTRGDVAEELARIASHLGQMREILDAPAQRGQGKTLDFLSQELLREVTTIGSKITSHEGSRFVIEAKGTIERIREQVQNVE